MTPKHGKQVTLQHFVKERLEEARERLNGFEAEAEEALKNLVAKGKEQRKELESLIDRLNVINTRELRAFETRAVKQLGKRANQASSEVKKRFEDLQSRVLEATGVASASQVKEINRELSKLGKKLDSLIGKKSAARGEARA